MESNTKAHRTWQSMLSRCYSESYRRKFTSYIGCTVCNEWLTFSNFKKWFEEHYVDGWELDKDILVKGNKVYGPDTCCFVPQELNSVILKSNRSRGEYPIGVSLESKRNKFRSRCNDPIRNIQIEHYGFLTPEDAFEQYEQLKNKVDVIENVTVDGKEI